MSRGKAAPKRIVAPDPKHGSELLAKFINFVMQDGKKTTAQALVYDALQKAGEKQKEDGLRVFEKAVDAIRPQVEVRSKRVGGANYQVPMPVAGNRQNALAFRWIVTAAKARKEKTMSDKLANEFVEALEGLGGAVKKKADVLRMAEANKAFAHFARRR